MQTFLQRYRDGEREAVWRDLLTLGEGVQDKLCFDDAYDVACETMTRVRANVELLISSLDKIGYQFRQERTEKFLPKKTINPFTGKQLIFKEPFYRPRCVFLPPGPEATLKIKELEQLVGNLPLSLRACYELVGEVDFSGYHPRWPNASRKPRVYSDPLDLCSVEGALGNYVNWSSNQKAGSIRSDERFRVWTGDYLTKEQISGSGYYIWLPNGNADAIFEGERHETSFVDYLRICFQWGGFPGFDGVEHAPVKDIAFLTEGLLDI